MNVFFYGLFMDRELLVAKGLDPGKAVVGFVDGYCLRLGQRAFLQRRAGKRVFGVVMTMGSEALQVLYSDPSVADYVPEKVTVDFVDGGCTQAVTYNLTVEESTPIDLHYQTALLELARRLGLPDSYLEQIEALAQPG